MITWATFSHFYRSKMSADVDRKDKTSERSRETWIRNRGHRKCRNASARTLKPPAFEPPLKWLASMLFVKLRGGKA